MIEVYEGRLGGGKTFSATCRALSNAGKGGYTISNVVFNFEECREYCRKYYGVEIEEDQFIYIELNQIEEIQKHLPQGSKEMPVLVILDEAHLWFNARDWNKTSKDFLSFLTQSRKVAVDFIFISQHANNMDKQFMRLIQYIWRFKDMQRLKIPIFGIMWPFPQIYAAQYDYDGRTLLFGEWIWKNKDVFKCYNTNALLKPIEFAGGRLEKKNLQKAARKKKASPSPAFAINFLKLVKVPAIVFLVVMTFWVVTLVKLKLNL